MVNPEHLSILKQGVRVWNEWRQNHPRIMPELRGADLSGMKLSEVNFFGADLHEANLTTAELTRADLLDVNLGGAILLDARLSEVDLDSADLSEAKLGFADLRRANLTHVKARSANFAASELGAAVLREADLSNAQFHSADLSEADLSGAVLIETDLLNANLNGAILSEVHTGDTIFANVDLSIVKGLGTVRHQGPSEISVNTIYHSGGRIPEVFMRGCGVPDTMIAFANSLVGKTIEFYSSFISYSSSDDDFARRLHVDLQASGVRVWFAPEDLKIGDKFRSSIEEAIRVHDKLMVVLSESSIHSAWVESEVEAALEKERQQRRAVLFPIRLDDAVMEMSPQPAWVAEIRRTRQIGDFRKWKEHDEYQQAFDRLLRDLQADRK
jgi:TIR domain/Pentapeptide repeats (8 copies)/Pentapeptide repeats (9 copies)